MINKIFQLKPRKAETDSWAKTSYSQSGEDLIVKFIFDILGIDKPSYLDIGAHHPYYLSNTALFYKMGSRGINIEPDPDLFQNFLMQRAEDINLNIGIAPQQGHADFYMMSSSTLNTFSKEDADKYTREGDYKITKVVKLPTDSVANVLATYAGNAFPMFLNIDAEGIDDLILNSIDFEKTFPLVICIETLSFSTTGNGVKNHSISAYLTKRGYLVYADTNINTIFVRKDLWQKK